MELLAMVIIIAIFSFCALMTINHENTKERRQMTPNEEKSFEKIKNTLMSWNNKTNL